MKMLIKAVAIAFLDKAKTEPFFREGLLPDNLPNPRDIGANIPKDLEGVYVLKLDREYIYVGKGKIKNRLISHYSKARGSANYYPCSWLNFLERRNQTPIKTTNGQLKHLKKRFLKNIEGEKLTVWFMKFKTESMRSAVEGCLIEALKPTLNSELNE